MIKLNYMANPTKDSLAHEELRLQLKGVTDQVNVGFQALKISITNIEKNSVETLQQVRKTNGRVDEQEEKQSSYEKELEIIRLFRRKKWLFGIFAFGIFKIYEIIDIHWIYTKLLALF